MKRLANGHEREPMCACQHGPGVHPGGRCVFGEKCGCLVWSPVPYVYDEDCPRCAALEAELRELRTPAPTPLPIPEQRQPPEVENHPVALVPRNGRWPEQVRRPGGRFGPLTDMQNDRGDP